MISSDLVSYTYPQGMTVAQLKEIVKSWPDLDRNGEPCTVWVVDESGLSNDVNGASPLDFREDGTADLALTF